MTLVDSTSAANLPLVSIGPEGLPPELLEAFTCLHPATTEKCAACGRELTRDQTYLCEGKHCGRPVCGCCIQGVYQVLCPACASQAGQR
jgi:hypothetical protein